MEEKIKLRDKLADIALQWQASFGVAPSITSSISEYDAAMLVGMSEKEYSDYMRDKTAVVKGTDFVYRNIRYQVKANRPSGKKGSKVTMVPKASNYEWYGHENEMYKEPMNLKRGKGVYMRELRECGGRTEDKTKCAKG